MEAVPLDDRGLLLGDGLFETLLWSGGALILGDAHAERMIRGAAVLSLPPPELAAFIALAEAAVRSAGLTEVRAAVRVTLTAGSGGRGLDRPDVPQPRLFATAAKATRPTEPAILALSSVRRNAASPASQLKTLAYLDNVLARREALAAGADEALMLNTDGHIAGAAAANLFWIKDGVLLTPPPEAGRLDGIMAGAVLAAAGRLGIAGRQVLAGPEALMDAEAVFLTNSLIGLRRVSRIGETSFGVNPVVEALGRAVAALA